jgi:hypothetical protein
MGRPLRQNNSLVLNRTSFDIARCNISCKDRYDR